MRRIILAALLALFGGAALAADTPVTSGNYNDFGCSAGRGIGCIGLTRPANTTAYAAGQLVCGATCAPLQIVAGRRSDTSDGSGVIRKVALVKSGSGATNAQFTVYLYSAPPTFTGLADQSAYTGPYLADVTSGNYVGSATCMLPSSTTDGGRYFVCQMDGWVLNYRTTGKILYAAIEATAAYTPASAESFYVVTYETQD
jgi:hypothetical protein